MNYRNNAYVESSPEKQRINLDNYPRIKRGIASGLVATMGTGINSILWFSNGQPIKLIVISFIILWMVWFCLYYFLLFAPNNRS